MSTARPYLSARSPLNPSARSPLTAGERLTSLSAHRIARLVTAGALSAEEVLAAHLGRIADLDDSLHALVMVDAERAVAAARRVDQDVRRGRARGPLTGVPVVVKDNIDVRGQTTACGSRAHRDVVAMRDAVVVARLRAAGAVLVGRANMDELAMGASTQTSSSGATRNPWDLRRSPGGSSGGSAAAVAAGLAPLSVGTDTGGSIREPASQCGVVGLAPSPGLVPMRGVVPFAPGLDRVGPIARTGRDAALLLSVLAGRAAPDDAPVSDLRALRVGVVAELAGSRNRPGVLDRLRALVEALEALGIEVVEVSVPEAHEALATYMALTSAACVSRLDAYVRTGVAGAEVVRRFEIGSALLRDGAGELAAARRSRIRLTRQVLSALGTCDVLLSPTMPTTAPLLDGETAEELADPMAAPYTDCWTVVANLTGLPAVSFPAGTSTGDGMPVGMMLAGRPGHDGDLLALADSCRLPEVALPAP